MIDADREVLRFISCPEEHRPRAKRFSRSFEQLQVFLVKSKATGKLFGRSLAPLLQPRGLGLGLETEFRGFEGVVLRHRVLGSIQAIEDQLSEEGIADLSSA